MRSRRPPFRFVRPLYRDWVLLVAALLSVILGVRFTNQSYGGQPSLHPAYFLDLLFGVGVVALTVGLPILLVRALVRVLPIWPDRRVATQTATAPGGLAPEAITAAAFNADGGVADNSRPGNGRRRPILVAGLAVGVVAVAAGLVLAQRSAQADSIDELLTAVEASEQLMVGFMDTAEDEFVRVGNLMDAGVVFEDEQVQVHLGKIREAASDALAAQTVAVHTLEDLKLGGQEAIARDAYVEHAEAWIDSYRAMIADPFADTAEISADISATFRIADDEFHELNLNSEQLERVETIFAD